jgi:hypothetical protein
MSHSHFAYPQPTRALPHGPVWQVREDQEPYAPGFTELIDFTDIIVDKLAKAEALAWVLHSAKEYPDNAVLETTAVIAEFIHEAHEAHTAQWEKVRKLLKRKR